MSAESPRRSSGSRGTVAATVPPQVVSDRSILDSAIGFINDVTLTNQPHTDPKDTITWARFETAADISDPRYGEDWEVEGNVAPPLLLILGYGLGVQVWAIPANGEAIEVLSWRHGIVSALRILPTPTTCCQSIETHGRADELVDAYAEKRPLIAIVDGSTSTGSQPQFCAVNFVSIKTGTQVKTIKFKNPVLDILANRSSIAITFHERIAVFDARTLEDRLSITTCYLSPGINPNPVALGQRWLAYAEHKLLHSKRSGGGCDGEGVASYTATVLNAAKSLGKGLRELGEQVAAGLTGTTGSISNSKSNSFDSQSGVEAKQPGVITILDIKYPIKDYSPTSGAPMSGHGGTDPIVAHFIAHSEAVVAMDFDNSGMLLVTADRRGHDFHIFRIQPHPVGPSLAAVHHLYVLHRGDTSAKVQNIAFSLDTRWIAVSTLRGTTHVFPITPYGGPMGVRTHTSLHVVNKLSRFHRSAGLSAEGRSNSPISHSESTTFTQSLQPYHNPTLPPFPRPTVVQPLAQLRQPFALGSPPGSAGLSIGVGSGTGKSVGGSSSQRQRLSSLSDDNGKPLSVCAIFAKSRSWLLEPPNVTREAPHRIQRKAVDSLFVMAGHGALIQYDLDTKLASNVAKEKICDDTPIELEVEAKAQWNLGRRKEGSQELTPPLPSDNWLVRDRNSSMLTDSTRHYDDVDERAESWLSQVEIITHAGPHRRLWMGPQFVFKTYNAPSGSNLSLVDAEAIEIGVSKSTTAAAMARAERSSPLNIAGRSAVPVLIESGSYSSIEQSPKLMDRFRHDHLDSDFSIAHGDTRLKEDLADAMRESPSVSSAQKDSGRISSTDGGVSSTDNPTFYDALAEHDAEPYEHELDIDQNFDMSRSPTSMTSAAALASVLPNLSSYDTSSGYESMDSFRKPKASIEKIVNPLGTVTTITAGMSAEVKTDMLDEVVSQLASEECVIHENCDEALFRPVVAIFCDENERKRGEEEARRTEKLCKPPEMVNNKLIVPVIAKEVDAELSKKEKEKIGAKSKQQQKKEQLRVAEKRVEQQQQQQQQQQQFFSNKTTEHIDEKHEIKTERKDSKVEMNLASKEYKIQVVETKSETTKTKNSTLEDTFVEKFGTNECEAVVKKQEPNKESEKNFVKNMKKQTQTSASKNDNFESTITEKAAVPIELNIKTSLPTDKHNKKETATSTSNTMTITKPSAKENTAAFPAATATATATSTSTSLQIKNKEKEVVDILKVESPTKSSGIKTESLNVADLADSLIDLKESCTEILTKQAEKPVTDWQPTEPNVLPVTKSSKKKKRAQSRPSSNSNSETEEVIEIAVAQKTKKSKQKDIEKRERKSSQSSESSLGDLADSINEPLSKESAMFLSFLQTEEKKSKKSMRYDESQKGLSEEAEDEIEILKIETPEKVTMEQKFKTTDSYKFKEKKEAFGNDEVKTILIKKETKNEAEKLLTDKTITDSKVKIETKVTEISKAPKIPPRSPKKKAAEMLKENFTTKPNITTSTPNKVITQQPTKMKRENSSDDSNHSRKDETITISNLFDTETNQVKQTMKFDGDETDSPKQITTPQIPVSPWKTLSGSELINKNLESLSKKSNSVNFPSLGESSKMIKKSTAATNEVIDKLLPDLPTPLRSSPDLKQTATENSINKASKKMHKSSLDDFPLINRLEELPPLPSLEPLEMLSKDIKSPKSTIIPDPTSILAEQVSLITFESPQKEDNLLDRKITSLPPHSFHRDIVYALCGDLHYEDENTDTTKHIPHISVSSFDENQSSTTGIKTKAYNNRNSKNSDKCLSSSPCSSASEEIIVLEEKKMTKKQKRKRQQHQMELQKSDIKSKVVTSTSVADEVDEELCPLISSMGDSQLYIDTLASSDHFGVATATSSTQLMDVVSTTTTDSSEGPMPATTSDDNVFTLPIASTTTAPNKLKTKKLEHKINLIAAIEAATSSSTSSAEESGVEGGSGRASDIETLHHHHHHHTPLAASAIITTSSSATAAMMALPSSLSVSAQLGATKKKTKRRFIFSNNCSYNIDNVDGKNNKLNNIDAKKQRSQPKQQHTILDSSITTTTATTTKNKDTILPAFGIQQHHHMNIGEQSTIVNIDIFEDQLSTSSISTNSRLSLDAHTSSSSPPISLNGVIDTNLMHFPAGGDSVDDVRGFDGADIDGVTDGASL